MNEHGRLRWIRLAGGLLISALLSISGCGGERSPSSGPEATYQGRPASEWVAGLQDADEVTRLEAVKAITAIGAAAYKATPALITMIEEGTDREKFAAIGALAAIGEKASEAAPLLADAVSDWTFVRQRKPDWARAMGDSLPAPYNNLMQWSSECSIAGPALLAIAGENAIDMMIDTLVDAPNEDTAECALRVIKNAVWITEGQLAEEAIEGLEQALAAERVATRERTLYAVSSMATALIKEGKAAGALKQAFDMVEDRRASDDAKSVRRAATEVMHYIARSAHSVGDEKLMRDALAKLVLSVNDSEASVAEKALEGLYGYRTGNARNEAPAAELEIYLPVLIDVIEMDDEALLGRWTTWDPDFASDFNERDAQGKVPLLRQLQIQTIRYMSHMGTEIKAALPALEARASEFEEQLCRRPSDEDISSRCQRARLAQQAIAAINAA